MSDKNDTDHYAGALLEDVNHKFDIILEYLAPLANVPGKLTKVDNRLRNVESDVKAIKLAVKGQSKDHRQLEKRVTKLEQPA